MLALPSKVEPIPYHAIFGVKFLAALGVFFLVSALVGRSPVFARLRQSGGRWVSLVIALGALIILVSGVLNQVRTRAAPNVHAVTPSPEA
jgi:hypothetical protein